MDYLELGTNIRSELQTELRSYLEGVPGEKSKTSNNFARKARDTELRFQTRLPRERFPDWILPGSVAILPKVNADLSMSDDELDLKGNFHYMANYDPAREMYLQLDSESDATIRAELSNQLRNFLEHAPNYYHGVDKFPAVVLPGSEAILPKQSKSLDLFDDAYDDSYHRNWRAGYSPRDHAYAFLETDAEINIRSQVSSELRAYLERCHHDFDKFPSQIIPGSVATMPTPSSPIDLFDSAYDD